MESYVFPSSPKELVLQSEWLGSEISCLPLFRIYAVYTFLYIATNFPKKRFLPRSSTYILPNAQLKKCLRNDYLEYSFLLLHQICQHIKSQLTKVLESPVGSRVGKQMGTQKLDAERYLTLHVYADKSTILGIP